MATEAIVTADSSTRGACIISCFLEGAEPLRFALNRNLNGNDLMVEVECTHSTPRTWLNLRNLVQSQLCWCGAKPSRLVLLIKYFTRQDDVVHDSTRRYLLAQSRVQLATGVLSSKNRSLCALAEAAIRWAIAEQDEVDLRTVVAQRISKYIGSCSQDEASVANDVMASIINKLLIAGANSANSDANGAITRHERECGAVCVLGLLDGYECDMHVAMVYFWDTAVSFAAMVAVHPLGVDLLTGGGRRIQLLVFDGPSVSNRVIVSGTRVIIKEHTRLCGGLWDRIVILDTFMENLAKNLYRCIRERIIFYTFNSVPEAVISQREQRDYVTRLLRVIPCIYLEPSYEFDVICTKAEVQARRRQLLDCENREPRQLTLVRRSPENGDDCATDAVRLFACRP